MQKILFCSVLLIFYLHVKSQDSIEAVLIGINKHAINIDESLFKINGSIKADRHSEMEQQTKDVKAALYSIVKEMKNLPGEYYNILVNPVTSFQTGIDEFEKLTLKGRLFDKDKLLNQGFMGLQQNQNELRTALKSAYGKALQQKEQTGIKNQADTKQADTGIVQNNVSSSVEQPALKKDTVAEHNNTAATSTTSGNLTVLDSIRQAQHQIKTWIDSIHIAMKKNHYTKVGVYAKSILNASLKISDLILFLNSDRKESLLTIVAGLKNLSEALHELSHKGVAAHHDMHETINEIEIKFSTFSTGISLVQ